MTKKPQPEPELDLGDRESEILRSIVHGHIVSGEPVGSRAVSEGTRLDLSPASIRAVMSELEERGLLRQPHASAGRVPTSQAYRLYVDRMIRRSPISSTKVQAIDEALGERTGEIAELLGEASRQLSRFSNQVGVVLAPALGSIVVENLEFVRLDARRVVVILVGRSGVVHNRILELDEPLGQFELDRIGRYLTGEFGGRTLPDVRELLRLRLSEERAAYDQLVRHSLELGRRALDADPKSAEVFVDGTSNLLDSPEFADPERIQSMMRTLEQRKTLIDLLGRILEQDGVQVVIGDEKAGTPLADCSLVASTYGSEGRVMGTLGVVGPTRMEYAQAIALVEYLAQCLTRFFSRGGH